MFFSLFLSFLPSPESFSACSALQKCVPARDVMLTCAVLFAVFSSLQLHRVCLQTNRMGQLVFLTACSADRSMDITVNTLSCFCRVVKCSCWWTRPSAVFLSGRSRLCSAWGRLVDPRLFKVIRVTVHKINELLLLLLFHTCSLSPYSTLQSFPVCFNGKSIGWINKSNNQWAQGSRQDRVPGRHKPKTRVCVRKGLRMTQC